MKAVHACRFALALLLALAGRGGAVTIEQIPTPRPAGWVTDLTGTLPAATLAELNRLGDEVKAKSGAEIAVVVVDTTGGAASRDFATRLFNAWGIGKAGKDNGILVFTALADHNVEIVLGDGLTGGDGVQASAAIVRDEMIPRFRQGDPAGAILTGAQACAQRILDVAPSVLSSSGPTTSEEYAAPPPLPAPERTETALSPPANGRPPSAVRSRFDPRTLVPVGLAGSLVGALLFALRAPRCRNCKEKMTKLDEAADDAYLEKSEQAEERVGSVDHQIWVCPVCGERKKRRFPRLGSGYTKCPECSARTLRSTRATIEEATYSHGGLEQIDQHCANCSYSHSYTHSTPMLQRPSDDDDRYSSSTALLSSTSSASTWSSSSDSSSSGSDFGGGHSSGDGASGHW